MGFTWDGFLQEISLLSLIEHPNACPFYGASTDSEHPFIIMKFFPRGSLKNLIEHEEVEKEKLDAEMNGVPFKNWRVPVDTSLIVNMCMNAANGINYLHSKNIIHRDIKAANFLIDEHFNVYVIDYGVSRVSPDDPQEKQTIVGTPVWMAPEVLSKFPYSSKADSYSFSLVLWGMVTGKVPYANVPALSLPLEVCFRKYREKIPENTDPQIKDLILKLWDENPDNRLTMQNLLDILYEMKDPVTQHYYCRVYDHLSDELIGKILVFLASDKTSLNALGCTSRRFNSLVRLHTTKKKKYI